MNVKFNLGGVKLTANGFDKHLAHFTTRTCEGKVITTPDTNIPDEHKHDVDFAIESMVIELEDFDIKTEAEMCKDLLSFAGNIFRDCIEYKKQQDKVDVEDMKRLKFKEKDMEKEIKDLTYRLEEEKSCTRSLEKKYKEVCAERDRLKFEKAK